VTALYAVQFIRPGAEGRIATVSLRWEDPQDHTVQEINGNFNTWDVAGAFEAASPRYQLSVLAAQYAEVLRHSPWAEGTSYDELSARAGRLAADLHEDPDVAEFAELVSRASVLNGW
jgi:Ca-activated chloride channel family protein